MANENLKYFGIDLGTTYSVIAYIDDTGRPSVVRNQTTGRETTPSVVYFENADNVVVGDAAKNVAVLYPERVVSRVKRMMGGDNQWEYDGATFTPESISALILKQLAADAAAATGAPLGPVVITVPAYFGLLERDATKKAGQIAGLDVIGIVPEPVAAALEYEIDGRQGPQTVLVYDLGGGTFDTTVIRIDDEAIEVLCTDGDQQLGGVDWDARLVQYIVDEFLDRASPEEDPLSDDSFMQDLAHTVEQVKRELSNVTSRQVPLRYAGANAMIEVTREKFEEITIDLLDRTIECNDRTLAKLGDKLGSDDAKQLIDTVLLVGGSSRMPMVTQRLREEYGWEPRLHDPDMAVAKGAARFALSRALWSWDGTGQAPTAAEIRQRGADLAQQMVIDEDVLLTIGAKRITTVLPKSFGVKFLRSEATSFNDNSSYYVRHLVHADEALPIEPRAVDAVTVHDNQKQVNIEIYEQGGAVESEELDDNKAMDQGAGVISGLPPLPRNSPIDITVAVDIDGILSLRAVEPTSGRDLNIQVQVSVLSQEQVVEATRAVSAIAVRS